MRYLFGLIVAITIAILGFNILTFYNGEAPPRFADLGNIKGSAVRAPNGLYTLNFDQQNFVMIALNEAVFNQESLVEESLNTLPFEAIEIYFFTTKEPTLLTPVGFRGKNLIFRSDNGRTIQETTEGALYNLLLQTIDHPNA